VLCRDAMLASLHSNETFTRLFCIRRLRLNKIPTKNENKLVQKNLFLYGYIIFPLSPKRETKRSRGCFVETRCSRRNETFARLFCINAKRNVHEVVLYKREKETLRESVSTSVQQTRHLTPITINKKPLITQ